MVHFLCWFLPARSSDHRCTQARRACASRGGATGGSCDLRALADWWISVRLTMRAGPEAKRTFRAPRTRWTNKITAAVDAARKCRQRCFTNSERWESLTISPLWRRSNRERKGWRRPMNSSAQAVRRALTESPAIERQGNRTDRSFISVVVRGSRLLRRNIGRVRLLPPTR